MTRVEATFGRLGRESAVRIALVYPELLGTYGDGGNATVLHRRLTWRGLPAEVVHVPAGEAVPEGCDVYLLGGGEDEPQVLAADGLRRTGSLLRAADSGAVVLAVCAGFQVIGESFTGYDGAVHPGLGLLGCETRRSFGPVGSPAPPRAVGDLVVDADPALRLPVLLGYENHGGRTRPLTQGTPVGSSLGRVRSGIGNGTPDGAEGMVLGRVVGTYLHGPVLAQNPALADLLLGWALGVDAADLPQLDRPDPAGGLRAARRAQLSL